MKEYNLFGYQIEINENATKDWYEKSKGWRCDCAYCQNFLLLAKKKELPTEVLDTLSGFDIPSEKPTYVCEIKKENGWLLERLLNSRRNIYINYSCLCDHCFGNDYKSSAK